MKKNDRVGLPQDCRNLMICLGWKCVEGADLDTSVVSFDGDRIEQGILYFRNKCLQGMKYSGDNLLGGNGRDDEKVHIDLN